MKTSLSHNCNLPDICSCLQGSGHFTLILLPSSSVLKHKFSAHMCSPTHLCFFLFPSKHLPEVSQWTRDVSCPTEWGTTILFTSALNESTAGRTPLVMFMQLWKSPRGSSRIANTWVILSSYPKYCRICVLHYQSTADPALSKTPNSCSLVWRM